MTRWRRSTRPRRRPGRACTELADGFSPDLRAWFADDPGRVERLTLTAADLWVDLSKNLLDDAVLAALLDARPTRCGSTERRDAMFAGERINVTEDRAVLHTALRLPADARLEVDGQDVVADVHEVLRPGLRRSPTGSAPARGPASRASGSGRSSTSGSAAPTSGPVMAYEALAPYVQDGLECRFISNIDPTDCATTLAGLDPATTLFIVSSKTFGTLETLTNARLCKAWLLDGLPGHDRGRRGGEALRRGLDRARQGRGLRDRPRQRVRLLGLGRRPLLPGLRDRYVAGGRDRPGAVRRAARRACTRWTSTSGPPSSPANVPALMGLLNVWYTNFLDAQTHAVLPYAQLLHRFPAYLQQLTMESNGKGVRWDGTPVTTDTGEVFWGEPGTNGQHAFYQLIHQGTRLVPADFIAVARPAYPLRATADDATCTTCSSPTSSPRPRRWRSARPPTRCGPRAPTRRSCRPASSPATGRRPRSWRPSSARRCSGS